MANVSISSAKIVYASLLEVPNLGYRNNNVGAISALRSPQSAQAIKGTDPRVGKDSGSLIIDTNGNAKMKVDFAPAVSKSFRTTRGQAGAAAVGTAGVGNIEGKTSSDILYDKLIEIEIRENLLSSDVFQTDDAIKYINGLLSGTISTTMEDTRFKPAKELLGQVGLEFLRRSNADMLVPMNDIMLTNLVAAVGKNKAYAAQVTPFCPQIKAFKSDGYTPHPELFQALRMTSTMNKFQGKPIVIGGTKLLQYFMPGNVTGLAASGFNLGDLIAKTEMEWHYDDRIDTIFGANKIIVIEPNAAVANFFQRHDSMYGTVKVNKQANMFYGVGTLDVIQYNNEDLIRSNVPGSYAIDYDLRVLEGVDTSDHPINAIVPSASFGVWTRPAQALSTISGDILRDVTGVYAFELVNEA